MQKLSFPDIKHPDLYYCDGFEVLAGHVSQE